MGRLVLYLVGIRYKFLKSFHSLCNSLPAQLQQRNQVHINHNQLTPKQIK